MALGDSTTSQQARPLMAPSSTTGNQPRPLTILAAAFLAGGAAAVGLNHFLDVHLSQRKPVVESEPIFVAMRSLPSGAPITVWDVALRNWPKAMLPTTAMRVEDSFDGMCLKMPLREGQPLLSVQLEPAAVGTIAAVESGGRDGGVIVVDDRTKIQMSWPAPPARDSAANDRLRPLPEPAHQTAITLPDDRLAIRPMAAKPKVPAAAEQAQAPAVVSPPGGSQLSAVAAAEVVATGPVAEVAEIAQPAEAMPEVLPPQLVATPEVIAPEREQLPEIQLPPPAAPPTPTPVMAAVEEKPAQPQLSSVIVPQERISALPPAKPVLPMPSPVVPSQRHLVVPERIAVMVDEVTTATRPQQETKTQAENATKPRSTGVGANPLRSPASRGSAQRSTPPSPVVPPARQNTPTVTGPTQQQAGRSVQPVTMQPVTMQPATMQPATMSPVRVPPVSAAAQQAAAAAESEATEAADNESRMFPRVSARLEKAGEDWSRFRESIFGSTQE